MRRRSSPSSCLAVGARWPRGRAEWTLVLVVGVLLFGGDYGLIYWAEQYIDSGLTAILFGTFTLATMIVAHFYVPGEQLTPRKITGGALAFIGVITLFGDRLNVMPLRSCPWRRHCRGRLRGDLNVATKCHGGARIPPRSTRRRRWWAQLSWEGWRC